MKNVLHVIDHLGLGGAQSVLLDLVAHTDDREFRTEVAVMHGGGMFAEALQARGVKVHSLATAKWPPVYLLNFVRLLRSGKYDVLHFHLQGSNWLAKPVSAIFSPARRVAHDHSSADLRFRKKWSLAPDAFAHFFSHCVIAVSPGVAGFLAEREFVPRGKIFVVPNGVDTKFFPPATERQRAEARALLGFSGNDFVAGSLGRLAPEKNFQSLARLARAMPQVQFVVGGEGPERRAILGAAGDAPNFRLAGQVSDRPAFYAALDVFLLPSLHEALPMTILEAMASEVPIIASDLEGVALALGDTGILVPSGDSLALEVALRSLSADPGRARRMAALARERVVLLHDARQTAGKISQLYRGLLG
ncbi:MAG: glycosyltransferase [Chthoniobacterales bacterium]|nr:glycosyltransferase [Chthoniobacterales bacterium]